MQRHIGLLMFSGAFLVAGCGGSALQAKAQKVVGDPHATVVSTETVQGLNGQPLTVVVMKPSGSTGLGCAQAQVSELVSQTVTGSLVPGCPRSSDAFVELWGSKLADGGDIGISRFQVAAIAKARSLSPRFQKFPPVNQLNVRCAIAPARAQGPTQSGMCATIAEPFGKPVRCVAFSEAWRARPASKLSTRGWVVTFSRGGQVQSTYSTAYPPQPWATTRPRYESAAAGVQTWPERQRQLPHPRAPGSRSASQGSASTTASTHARQ